MATELPETMDALAQQVSVLRASLQSSQGNTEGMVAILGSFDERLSELEATIHPIQVRAHATQMAHENIDKAIKVADDILAQVVIVREAEATILRGPHVDLESYLKAVGRLKDVVGFFSLRDNFTSKERFLNDVNVLLSKSSLMIEEEFKRLMITYSKPIEGDLILGSPPKLQWASDGDAEADGRNSAHSEHPSKRLETAICRTPTLIPTRILQLLHTIAQKLVQDGNQQSCFKIYRDARRSALQLSFQKLGVEKLSKDDVERMQSDALEAKIGKWTEYLRITVFEGISFNKDQCFAELAGIGVAVAKTLLSFGDAVAKSKRSSEKLFVLLDMYEVMHDVRSEVEVIFEDSFWSEMPEAAFGLMKLLAQTAHEMFVDFEELVEKDTSKTNVHDGTVHSFTIYVINHVKFLFDYQSTLKLLFQGFETGSDTESQLAVVLTKIMQALQNNIHGKSKQYKDPALMCIFIANNIHYMVRSVCRYAMFCVSGLHHLVQTECLANNFFCLITRSEAKDILGDDWIERHRRIVQQHAQQYKRVAWGKALQTLSIKGDSSSGISSLSDLSSSGVSRAMIKERFKSFNMQFEELRAKQSLWIIPDQELRETLRLSIAEVLLPAYQSFVKRFGNLVEDEKKPRKYFKYQPDELDQLLGEFFEGQQSGEQKK
ncbi:exocyst complex component EXO70A1-like isoform X2 [Hordeum vulgare subsp. vulgare]|uniref:exocyst complex component EXO70A1-like isoform X2 n=1 Tax=Hordeum vulgare subsp. vulgare TaxID=112509 RepID=UPI001D1A463F|nr:exocyst complex component EXO70A1-like isoform X2 [Hordeum vulgare subsp. vulgare]